MLTAGDLFAGIHATGVWILFTGKDLVADVYELLWPRCPLPLFTGDVASWPSPELPCFTAAMPRSKPSTTSSLAALAHR
jgi:hypothetical protein